MHQSVAQLKALFLRLKHNHFRISDSRITSIMRELRYYGLSGVIQRISEQNTQERDFLLQNGLHWLVNKAYIDEKLLQILPMKGIEITYLNEPEYKALKTYEKEINFNFFIKQLPMQDVEVVDVFQPKLSKKNKAIQNIFKHLPYYKVIDDKYPSLVQTAIRNHITVDLEKTDESNLFDAKEKYNLTKEKDAQKEKQLFIAILRSFGIQNITLPETMEELKSTLLEQLNFYNVGALLFFVPKQKHISFNTLYNLKEKLNISVIVANER